MQLEETRTPPAILIIEDDTAIRTLLQAVLEDEGYPHGLSTTTHLASVMSVSHSLLFAVNRSPCFSTLCTEAGTATRMVPDERTKELTMDHEQSARPNQMPAAGSAARHPSDHHSYAIFVLDANGRIQYADAHAATLMVHPPGELTGTLLWRSAPWLVSNVLYQAVRTVVRTHTPVQVTYRTPLTPTLIHASLSPAGEEIMLVVHERALPRGEAEQERFAHLTGEIAILTPEGLLLEINQQPVDRAQVRREEVLGQPFIFFPTWSAVPEAQAQLHAAIARASQGDVVHVTTRIGSNPDRSATLTMTVHPGYVEQQVTYLVWTSRVMDSPVRTEDDQPSLLDEVLVRGTMYYAHTGNDPRETASLHLHGAQADHRFSEQAQPLREMADQSITGSVSGPESQANQRMEEAFRQNHQRVWALVTSPMVGMFLACGEQIIEANDTFLRLTGYSQDDLLRGRLNWLRMTAPEDVTRTLNIHQELPRRQYIPPYEKDYLRKDGSRASVLVWARLTHLATREIICFVLDNAARQELAQRQEDFLNTASHELRTPLTAIKLQVQLTLRRLGKRGEHHLVAELREMEPLIHRLERLIGELLDVSRLRLGQPTYQREPVEIDGLLRQVADLLQHAHPTHRIDVHGPRPLTMLGDRGKLTQAVTNLLENAINYSPAADRVEVRTSASTATVTISIHDEGIGIPREQQPHIFERFYRVSHQRQGSMAGLGLGLYLTAEIIRHHGGTITVESQPGIGSTFLVTLPRVSRSEQQTFAAR